MKKISVILLICLSLVFFSACTETKPINDGNTAETNGSSDELLGMPNPVVETDRAGFISALGFYMGVPEGAKNVTYRVINNTVGEMSFEKDGMEYTARMKDYPDPIEIGSEEALKQYISLSGYYYDFKSVETCKIGYCTGEIIEYKNSETGKTVQVVSWDDVVPGFLYTLSVESNDLDGFDISAVANEVFVPMQGDA